MIKGEIFLDFRENYCKKQGGILKLNGEDQPAVKASCFRSKPVQKWDNWQVCNILNCPFFNKYEVTEYDIEGSEEK